MSYKESMSTSYKDMPEYKLLTKYDFSVQMPNASSRLYMFDRVFEHGYDGGVDFLQNRFPGEVDLGFEVQAKMASIVKPTNKAAPDTNRFPEVCAVDIHIDHASLELLYLLTEPITDFMKACEEKGEQPHVILHRVQREDTVGNTDVTMDFTIETNKFNPMNAIDFFLNFYGHSYKSDCNGKNRIKALKTVGKFIDGLKKF